MAEKEFPMSAEGKAKLEKQVEELKTVRRPEIVERIKVARSYGDLSENSEYESAKDEQAFVEGKIAELENMIRYAVIIDNEGVDKNEIFIGKTVKFRDLEFNEDETVTIVGSAEADPFEGKISNESAVAKGLIGHKTGEEVTFPTPGGDMKVKILEVVSD
ncbi:MAG: transcription elongation factor GreA [Streptococcaceae bacterium]|jgi:transcription elongation factor GreA|nr:transcription elongation factor GreA [Streptococcaceae bacterium]